MGTGLCASIRRLILVGCFAFCALAPYAEAPRLKSEDYAARAGGLSEPLSVEDLARLALQASGAKGAELEGRLPKLLAEASAVADRYAAIADRYRLGEAVLQAMHADLLSRYFEPQTRVDVLLQAGTYNCVSSAVVYMILAKAVGLSVGGVATADHAFCVVQFPGDLVDVETTNKFGFDPGTKKEFLDSFGKATGYSYVPQKNYALRRSLGEKETVALILSNRISELERAKRFDEAVPLAVDEYAIVGSRDAFAFLIERISNCAGDLVNRERYDEAFALLDRAVAEYGPQARFDGIVRTGIGNRLSRYLKLGAYAEATAFVRDMKARYGDDPQYADFLKAAANNRAVEAIRRNDFKAARAVLDDETVSEGLSVPELEELRAMVDKAELDWAVRTLPFREALARVSSLSGSVPPEEIVLYLYSKEAERVAKAKGWLEGAALFDEALRLLPASARLAEARTIYRSNYASDAHNKFAALFNARKYADAMAVLDAAIALAPESELLKRDADAAQKALKGK
jgi:tetratricopeptide (TPR) repeat protein